MAVNKKRSAEIQISKPAKSAASKKYKYKIFSEVDRIRILRDIYKKKVQRNFDEQIKTKLQSERDKAHQQVKSATLLIKHGQNILNTLTQQCQATHDALAETIKNVKPLVAQLQQNRNNKQSINQTEASFKMLVSELNDA